MADLDKDHESYMRISAISQILPLEQFIEICRKVYFSIDGYSDADFILANGFLYAIFSQHIIGSGLQDYQKYSQYCRTNLEEAVLRLPLLLPASMEMIAVLVLAVYTWLEDLEMLADSFYSHSMPLKTPKPLLLGLSFRPLPIFVSGLGIINPILKEIKAKPQSQPKHVCSGRSIRSRRVSRFVLAVHLTSATVK